MLDNRTVNISSIRAAKDENHAVSLTDELDFEIGKRINRQKEETAQRQTLQHDERETDARRVSNSNTSGIRVDSSHNRYCTDRDCSPKWIEDMDAPTKT